MKGQVFTAARLHYVHGILYEAAKHDSIDLGTLANLSTETTKSGNVKHPLVRVRTLARLAAGIGLIEFTNKRQIRITALGKLYVKARAEEKWQISEEQKRILGKFILSDYYRTETIYAITSLYELYKKGYRGEDLSHRYSIEIGKDNAWKSDVTFRGFTEFGLNYIEELGLLELKDEERLFEDIVKEQRYQEDSNSVEQIIIPPGKILRPNPKKYGSIEKYIANPRRARIALEIANYECEFNKEHKTFINKKSNRQYMEAHHLIPMSYQKNFEYDIDIPENIFCICANCHRKIHLSRDNEKKEILARCLNNRKADLILRGIEIDLETLISFY